MRHMMGSKLLMCAFCATIAFLTFAAPSQARFLQTDPAGYQADQNLYGYVRNDPTDENDPSGLYDYNPSGCQTGSRLGCALGFRSLQEKATDHYRNAIGRLSSAIADMKSVAARQAAGDKTAAISSTTAKTQSDFTHSFGAQSDLQGAMQFELGAFQAALAGLEGSNPAANAAGNDLTTLQNRSAPAGAFVNSHSLMINPNIWNNIDPIRSVWSLMHEPLHGEAGWKDYVGPHGEKYYRWDEGGHSPLELSGPNALTNPDNAVCFIAGGC